MNKHLLALAKLMSALYPDVAASTLFMAEVGMNAGRILAEQQPVTRWFFIVNECDKAGLIPALLQAAIAEYPDHTDLRSLYIELDGDDKPSSLLLLIAAIGSDAALSLDLASLRAVRTATGMEFARIKDATLDALKTALDRERAHGRRCNVHLAVHSSPLGVELGGKVIDAVALSEILDGVQVLLIAGCQSDQIGDFLGVVPAVVSFSEDVGHNDAAAFTLAWWTAIGDGLEPAAALRYALQRAPSGLQEFVTKSW